MCSFAQYPFYDAFPESAPHIKTTISIWRTFVKHNRTSTVEHVDVAMSC